MLVGLGHLAALHVLVDDLLAVLLGLVRGVGVVEVGLVAADDVAGVGHGVCCGGEIWLESEGAVLLCLGTARDMKGGRCWWFEQRGTVRPLYTPLAE